jgi:sialidase-1
MRNYWGTTGKQPDWGWYATGPGVGIQLRHGPHAGRLVIPCDHRERENGEWVMHSHVFFSDDGGQTWQLGGSAGRHTDECQVVELTDGTLLLNMRNYWGTTGKQPENGNRRALAWSKDGGATWSDVQFDAALVEPICQASLLALPVSAQNHPGVEQLRDGSAAEGRLAGQSENGARLLFCNPANTSRVELTVRLSYDAGRTWPFAQVLNHGPAAYSCLAALPDGRIGCLYERGRQNAYETITFARCALSWLTGG